MAFSYWFGVLTNISIGIQGWVFLTLLSTIGVAALSYGIHFLVDHKVRTIAMIASFSLALILLGILGFVYFSVVYLISFALFSDFRRDYQ